LSKKARSDIRYFPNNFRRLALAELKYVKSRSYEESGDRLVKAFGTYIIYCFSEAVQASICGNSKLSLYWLEDVLSPFNMYLYFLSSTFYSGNKHKRDKSLYKSDNESIEMLTQALKNNYPSHYESLLKAKTSCLKMIQKN
jgi:hypothetical protein